MEPTRKSVLTAARTMALAAELGIPRVYGLGNKAREGDADFFRDAAAAYGVPLAGVVPHDEMVAEADRAGTQVAVRASEAVRRELGRILDSVLGGTAATNGAEAPVRT